LHWGTLTHFQLPPTKNFRVILQRDSSKKVVEESCAAGFFFFFAFLEGADQISSFIPSFLPVFLSFYLPSACKKEIPNAARNAPHAC
jgi:hypothetical protein